MLSRTQKAAVNQRLYKRGKLGYQAVRYVRDAYRTGRIPTPYTVWEYDLDTTNEYVIRAQVEHARQEPDCMQHEVCIGRANGEPEHAIRDGVKVYP